MGVSFMALGGAALFAPAALCDGFLAAGFGGSKFIFGIVMRGGTVARPATRFENVQERPWVGPAAVDCRRGQYRGNARQRARPRHPLSGCASAFVSALAVNESLSFNDLKGCSERRMET